MIGITIIMKMKKRKCRPQIRSEQEYLFRLGRNLLLYFPAEQVMEILTDYKEYFHSGSEKRTVKEIIEQWGDPSEVTQDLLKEHPQARLYAAKWTLLWGAVLIFSVFAMFHIQKWHLPYNSAPAAFPVWSHAWQGTEQAGALFSEKQARTENPGGPYCDSDVCHFIRMGSPVHYYEYRKNSVIQ